jgi:DNA-directed RNA polymerase subunit RPC12/RpoP
MKVTKANETCSVCAKKSKRAASEEDGLCPNCSSMVALLKKKPEVLQQLARKAGVSSMACLQSKHMEKQVEQELPDVLDGVRYRTTDRERNTWYVSISELDGNPVEIFASTAFDRDQHLQSRISNLTTITRLISLTLRHIFMGERLTLEKTLTQLKRSSRQPNDLPDMLSKILAKYTEKTATEDGQKGDYDETVIP